MKKIFHKSMALFMAVVVFTTTTSFAVEMHYCGETLVDFSFVQQVKTCGMEQSQSSNSCEGNNITRSSCCSDDQVVVEGTDDLKLSYNNLSFEQQVFVTAFTYAYLSRFEHTQSTEITFVDYPPPFIEQDVQILYQTFLI